MSARHARTRRGHARRSATVWLPQPAELGVPAAGRHRAPSPRTSSVQPAALGTAALVVAGGAAVIVAPQAAPVPVTVAAAAPAAILGPAERPVATQSAASRSGTRNSLSAQSPAVSADPVGELGAAADNPAAKAKHAKPVEAPAAVAAAPEGAPGIEAVAPVADAAAGIAGIAEVAEANLAPVKAAKSGPPTLYRGCGYNARIQQQPDLDAAQRRNARTIVEVGQELDLPPRAAVIALATAYQESWLRNLSYGDRDSLGLFQQRPSYGWGTPKQLQTPEYAAAAFYRPLADLPGWKRLPVTVAAQEVQRSAFPDRYAQWELMAAELVDDALDVPNADLNCNRG